MKVRMRTEGVRLLLIFPNCFVTLGLRAAVRFGGEDLSEDARTIMLALSAAARKTHWRRYRGLELIHVSTEDGTELTVKV